MGDEEKVVSRDFCDERHGNLEESVKSIKKDVNRLFWIILTGMIAALGNDFFGHVIGAKAQALLAWIQNLG